MASDLIHQQKNRRDSRRRSYCPSQNLDTEIPGVNIEKMAEGPVYKGLEEPKIYRRHDLLLLGVSARERKRDAAQFVGISDL